MSDRNLNLTLGSVCTRFWKASSHAGSFLFFRLALGLVPTKPPIFFLCRQRRAVCVGQEHPRVPGDRPPGRPVFPVEGKARLGGLEGMSTEQIQLMWPQCPVCSWANTGSWNCPRFRSQLPSSCPVASIEEPDQVPSTSFSGCRLTVLCSFLEPVE